MYGNFISFIIEHIKFHLMDKIAVLFKVKDLSMFYFWMSLTFLNIQK